MFGCRIQNAMLSTHRGAQQGSTLMEWFSDLQCKSSMEVILVQIYLHNRLTQIKSAQLTRYATAFQEYFIKERKYKIMDTWLASERYHRTKIKEIFFFYIFSFLWLSMTRPIRNTWPCFPSGLPRQRDVLSHTEYYTPIFCMLSVFQAIPSNYR